MSKKLLDSPDKTVIVGHAGVGVGGLHKRFMRDVAKTTKIPLTYLTTDTDFESLYSTQMLLYERLRNKFHGYIAWKLSGMTAKQYINRRMYAARSNSKRRHAISPLNKRILNAARSNDHFSNIKLEDLKGLSRDYKLMLFNMLKQNSTYGIMLFNQPKFARLMGKTSRYFPGIRYNDMEDEDNV